MSIRIEKSRLAFKLWDTRISPRATRRKLMFGATSSGGTSTELRTLSPIIDKVDNAWHENYAEKMGTRRLRVAHNERD